MSWFFLSSVAWVALIDVAAWGFGIVFFDKAFASKRTNPFELVGYPLVLGLCFLGFLSFLLGVVGLFFELTFIVIVALGVLVSIYAIVKRRNVWKLEFNGALPDILFDVSVFVLLVLFLSCFEPQLKHDSLVYHLRLPKLYMANHGMIALPTALHANMPHNMELLFTLAFSNGGLVGSRILSFQFSLITFLGILIFAYNEKMWPVAGALCLLYVSGPCVQWHIPTAHTEAAMGCFLLFAFLFFLKWLKQKESIYLIVSCVLMGWLIGCKYTALLFIPGVLTCVAIALVVDKGEWSKKVRHLSMVGGILLVCVAPWLIRNLEITGNPVYPMFHSILGGRWWSDVQAMQFFNSTSYLETIPEIGRFLTCLAAPWHLVFDSQMYGVESYSASLMLLFVAAVFFPGSYRGNRKYVLVAAYLGFLVFDIAPAPKEGRYLVTLVPLMVLTAGPVLSKVFERTYLRYAAVLLISCIFLGQNDIRGVHWEVFTKDGYENVLKGNTNYRLCERLNEELPESAKLFFAFENRIFFCEHEAWTDSLYQAPYSMQLIREAGGVDEAYRTLKEAGITHLVMWRRMARRYFTRDNPYPMLDYDLLPEEQFEREARIFRQLLETKSRLVLQSTTHGVFELLSD